MKLSICNRRINRQMYSSFKLLYSCYNTVQILPGSFYVSLSPADINLFCLQKITRIVFVGNSQRNNVELAEVMSKIASAAHAKHLQHSLLCPVISVFCSAIT